MYRLRDAHGLEEGPYSIEQIRERFLMGQLPPGTLACREGETAWQPLSNVLSVLPPSPASTEVVTPPPLPQRATPSAVPVRPPLPPSAPVRRSFSGWAIASLVLSLGGVLVLPALASLLCGVVGLIKVGRSRGALRGAWMALTGVIISVITLLGVVLIAPMVMNNRRMWRPPPPTVVNSCWQNLPKLGKAVLHYANDHADLLPHGTNWCDAVRDYVPSMSVFTCPGAPANATSIFAINQSLVGKSLDQVAPETVLLFESDPGWNVAGGRESVAQHGTSPGVVYIFTVGGQVQMVPLAGLGSLRWSP